MNNIKDHGSSIMDQLAPTNKAFEPLLRANEKEILSFTRKTFKYGATDRHQLDVYFPHSDATGSAPILFFVYGGGYASGARVFDPPDELKYKNVGAFFAKRGFVVVIADYRIYPGIKFPDPIVDIRDAFTWVVSNISLINEHADVQADASRIFFMGHSAGAAIVSSMILIPDLLSSSLRERIVGLILNAGAYDYRGAPMLPPLVVSEYHGGTDEDLRKKEPLGLLENAPTDILNVFPPVLAVIGEFDFPPIVVSHGNFVATLNKRLSSPVDTLIMEGHNHISPHNSLCSGEGEQWGLDVVGWLQSKLA